MKKNQHVVPYSDGKWAVKKAWSDKVTKTFSTQKEAIDFGKDIAKNNKSELFIHWKTWRIRERNTYGDDNFPPKW